MNTEKPADKKSLPALPSLHGSCCVITVSETGAETAERIASSITPVPDLYITSRLERPGFIPVQSVARFFEESFNCYDTIICVMATGIAVRSAAPLLRHKSVDPGILVLDPAGHFVISLLSGHLGHANENAGILASAIGAVPVITTASDTAGLPAADILAEQAGFVFEDFETAKRITAAILERKPVQIIGKKTAAEEAGQLFGSLPEFITTSAELPDAIPESCAGIILLSDNGMNASSGNIPEQVPVLRCVPESIVAGIGCRRGTPASAIREQLRIATARLGSIPEAVCRIATIGLKANEAGLREIARTLKAELVIIPDDQVRSVQHLFDGSDFVEKTTGLRAVSEPCGYVASGYGKQLAGVIRENGVTVSLWQENSTPGQTVFERGRKQLV
ncbi:MAG: cobalt-precorrin 5A hydrolase [Eubacteriaceae bacterium]|jgi:cobalt-precorrin 5A hydrolase